MTAEPYLAQIARTIQLSVAPVFLLTAIGTTLAVLTNRLGRIVDRAHKLEDNVASRPPDEESAIYAELSVLSRRARLINVAITLGTVCALLICVLIACMFIGAFFSVDIATMVSLLFVTAMLSFIGALLSFLGEIYIAIRSLRIGMK